MLLLLGLGPLVFALPGGIEVVVGAGESLAKSGGIGQGFGVRQSGAFQQPRRIVIVGQPRRSVALQVVGGLKILPLFTQPAGQLIPLAQQAFQGDLDNNRPVFAFVFDHQPFGHEFVDQCSAVLGQVAPAGHPTHRLVVVGVNRGQPRNKRRPQQLQLLLALTGVGGQQPVDLGLHDVLQAAHRLVVGQGEPPVGGVLVEPSQRQGQQRQRVSTLGAVLKQPVDQRGFHVQGMAALGGADGGASDDFLELGGRHRFEIIEQHRGHPAQLRSGLQRLITVGADGDRHNQPHPARATIGLAAAAVWLAAVALGELGDQLQKHRRFAAGVGADEFLGLIQRQHQRRERHLVGPIQQLGAGHALGLTQQRPNPGRITQAGAFNLPEAGCGQPQPGAGGVNRLR